MNFILPVAGKSTRYSTERPKWMQTHPVGNMMLVDALIPIVDHSLDDIHVIYLEEHEKQFSFKRGLKENFAEYGFKNIKFWGLDKETNNQVQTVREGLKKITRSTGDIEFIVKDCDNRFFFEGNYSRNFIGYVDLEKTNNTDPASKSYIVDNEFRIVSNIAEKKIISNKFCCGAYGFGSSDKFLAIPENDSPHYYLSDVIFEMMLKGEEFKSRECSYYEDWGTLEQWNQHKRKYKTIFCDIDGTLFENSSHLFPPYIGESDPIRENISFIKSLKSQLILTTARPEKYREETIKQLSKEGISFHSLIMGLNHCERIIVNDFSPSNPYPSCSAVNIPRNSPNLKEWFK